MRLILIVLILLLSGVQGCIPGDNMSKQAGLAVTDGIWLQYACPQAVSGGGKTFWGWVDTKGDICVASYNHSTQEIVKTIVSAAFDADDHSAPSLLIRSDGKIIVFYTEHLRRLRYMGNTYGMFSGNNLP